MRAEVVDQFPDPAIPRVSYDLDGVTDRQEFLSSVRGVLGSLFGADAVSWNAIDRATGLAEVFGYDTQSNAHAARLLAEIEDHPMVNSYVDPRQANGWVPRRISDVVSRSELLRTRAYAELMRPFRAEYQMTIMTARRGSRYGGCWSLTRASRDFDDRDRARAEVVQSAVATLDQCWWSRVADREADSARIDRLGLTPRELEVLNLVARGLTADSCGRALRISGRTVRKHLQNAYAKLDCHDRLTAVAQLRQLGILPTPPPLL